MDDDTQPRANLKTPWAAPTERAFKFDERPQRNLWAPGSYYATCCICGERFLGDKRAVDCADCAYAQPDTQPSKHDDPSAAPPDDDGDVLTAAYLFGVLDGKATIKSLREQLAQEKERADVAEQSEAELTQACTDLDAIIVELNDKLEDAQSNIETSNDTISALNEAGLAYDAALAKLKVAKDALVAIATTEPWQRCQSTHCERAEECRSPSDCNRTGRGIANATLNQIRNGANHEF